ncbi:hypothetical protein [Acetivibrio mesophilus]|uniref:Uncharacterized protein n=1 Tax=Acetivibrio mesophilus TaxID=2487273 RepID=A0A4Q0I5D5_9FIRM|nr:hypothetical protein [Acetivibrio mesophilus]ODM26079.1 hypothetical protein A7W90_07465 [Clostridium sp. Bc-iso-3]RXE59047.1 hypothetical protein EFD62_08765 [Acetivibrio mesophilus]HHV28285.1 hypothetical protein [Clostridium sp.]
MGNIMDKSRTKEIDGMLPEIIYNQEKDFYKAIGGELRMKAEGLFKKAKEKGISIEDVSINTLKENRAEFPGLGEVELPSFIVKIRGRDMTSGQIIVDGKQIDYYNRYQKYVAQRIEDKNTVRDENGKIAKGGKKAIVKENPEFSLTDWEKFRIAKDIIEDKEFGLEKTITGACDRIIRKLMGENDWLAPEEARLLDEEFNSVQSSIYKGQEKKQAGLVHTIKRKATERQINYFKQRIKNMGMNPDDSEVLARIFDAVGVEQTDIRELSIGDMSKIIESLNSIALKIKDEKENMSEITEQ